MEENKANEPLTNGQVEERMAVFREKYEHSSGRRYRQRVNAKAVRKSAARLKVKRG